MQLDQVTAELRPRNPWEAMDLGVALLRTNLKAVYVPWLLTVLPFALVTGWVFRANLALAALIVWWFKPVYDRLVLFVLSRALFGATPHWRETLRSLPTILASGSLWGLTLYRFDLARSFNLPVWQLEGLRGGRRWRRAKVLNADARSQAFGLHLGAVHIEFGMQMALMTLLVLLVPADYQAGLLESLFVSETSGSALASVLAYLLAMTLVEPLYVACGFTLYLNRRTQLEGWDIEVAFRRLTQRLQRRRTNKPGQPDRGDVGRAAALALLVFAAATVQSPTAQASTPDLTDPEQAQATIQEVLADDSFGAERQVTYWDLKDRGSDDEPERGGRNGASGFALGLARLGEFGIWILLFAGVIFIVANHGRWSRWGRQSADRESGRPTTLFGMKITRDSLPDDIAAAAWSRWERGEHREAISLLYRGALATLVDRDGLKLGVGATEGDCLSLVQAGSQADLGEYFSKLTEGWLRLAYAHRTPSHEQAQELCRRWPMHFGEATPENAHE